MTTAQGRRATSLSVGLAFVAGYVDTVGFVALFGLFTAHVTGNFVLIGAALAHASGNVLLKLLVFPAFILAVAGTRLIVLVFERRKRSALRPLLALQVVLLGGFAACGWAASPIGRADVAMALGAGILGATAMGVQNAAARLALPELAPTTVMTGNVTQLVIDVVDVIRGGADGAVRQRSVKFVWPIVAFAAGAVGGAFGYVDAGFVALLVPMLVIGWLAVTDRSPAAA